MKMKEKLVKNHYKGFDKKARIFAYMSISLLFMAVCTFLPLTAIIEAKVQTLQLENNENKTTEKAPTKTQKERFTLTYSA